MRVDKVASRRSPINDADPSCERTRATLCIYDVDPDLVTEKLGIEPTNSWKIGRAWVTPRGEKRVGRVNTWELESEGAVLSKDLRRHLDWLLDRIEPAASQLTELQEIPGVTMTIWCTWWSAHLLAGPKLWPEQMRRMADLNLECLLCFSCYPEEDD